VEYEDDYTLTTYTRIMGVTRWLGSAVVRASDL